jgi:hypothetical protein
MRGVLGGLVVDGLFSHRWEFSQEGLTAGSEFLFQPCSAIAVAASPGFASIFVAALPPVVCVLNFGEIEILFPVRAFFLQRRRTITYFDPAHRLVGAKSRFTHIAQVFAFGNRAAAKTLIIDCAQKICFSTGLYAGSDQVTHTEICRLMRSIPEGYLRGPRFLNQQSIIQMNISSCGTPGRVSRVRPFLRRPAKKYSTPAVTP